MSLDPERKREYMRLWMQDRRKDYFTGKACVRCGSTDNLQLHHKDPKKKTSHKIWSWTKERREAEIRKCEVLCQPCHAAHHTAERRKRIRHGTYASYDTLRCRCATCRSASAAYRQELRQRARAAAR